MLKRKIAGIVGVLVLSSVAGAALADNSWPFDDPYWQQALRRGASTATAAKQEGSQATAAVRLGDGFWYKNTGGVPPQ